VNAAGIVEPALVELPELRRVLVSRREKAWGGQHVKRKNPVDVT
jgi:hypothetical protein